MEDEVEEAKAGEEEAEKKGGGLKKKIILGVVVLLVGYQGAKMTVLKPPPPTQAEADAAEKVETLETWATCAAENDQEFDVELAAAEIDAEIAARHAQAEAMHFETGAEEVPDEEVPDDDDDETNEGSAPGGGGGLGFRARPAAGGGAGSSAVNPVYEYDPVTLNLADGEHYVKVRLALQLKAGVDVELLGTQNFGSKAQDLVNTRLRGMSLVELQAPDALTALKNELGNEVCRAYHGEVTTIYFPEFVMQ